MKSKTILAKIGGKIIENHENLRSTLNQFKSLLFEKKKVDNVILIPGGGSYANFVRKLDNKLNIGDNLSHWMAIFAMNCNGIAISERYKEINCISDINELKKNKASISIFLPFDFLYKTNELPHSWSVTSDTIAIYIAYILKLNQCFLIKDVDGIFINNQSELIQEISTKDFEKLRNDNKLTEFKIQSESLKKSKPIDLYSLKLINDFKISCIILNGHFNYKRIIEFFDELKSENEKIYTRIINRT